MNYEKRAIIICLASAVLLLGACQVIEKGEADGTAVKYTIVDEEKVPQEMKECISKMEGKPFQITYKEGDWLYIGQGYGRQKKQGYAIRVDSCAESEDAIYVKTTLLGPGSDEVSENGEEKENVCMREGKLSKDPYVVWKMGGNEKQVIFR